jgi:hypothetical protein
MPAIHSTLFDRQTSARHARHARHARSAPYFTNPIENERERLYGKSVNVNRRSMRKYGINSDRVGVIIKEDNAIQLGYKLTKDDYTMGEIGWTGRVRSTHVYVMFRVGGHRRITKMTIGAAKARLVSRPVMSATSSHRSSTCDSTQTASPNVARMHTNGTIFRPGNCIRGTITIDLS